MSAKGRNASDNRPAGERLDNTGLDVALITVCAAPEGFGCAVIARPLPHEERAAFEARIRAEGWTYDSRDPYPPSRWRCPGHARR